MKGSRLHYPVVFTFVLWGLFAFCCGTAEGTRVRGDFHVSARGDDNGPGSRARPFATLERAQAAVREAMMERPRRDVVVLVHEGTYYLPEGLTFGPEDGGTEERRVIWAAYGDDVPVLVGGRKLTDWQRERGEVFTAPLPTGHKGMQLFQGRRRMDLARSPEEGYFKLQGSAKADGKLAFVYRPQDVQPGEWDVRDARVSMWPYHDWFNHIYRLERVDEDRRVMVLDARERDLLEGNRYFVENVRALLDRAGECRISASEGKVYAWPHGGRTGLREIVLSTAHSVIRVRGEAERPVRNLHFEGLDIAICEENAVDLQGAQDCSVRGCLIENAGVAGVMIHGAAGRVVVYGNEIREHGQHGVSIQGGGMSEPCISEKNRVENNHIHHCGRLIGHGYGVRISQSARNEILHNHIHHMPRYGVSIKGSRYKSVEGKIPGMTWENRYGFMHGRENRIAYNDIHHTNLESQDTGAIESWGSGRDNVIDHNLIHDTGNAEFNLQSGVYLDDQADYWTVSNNIIWGVRGTSGNQCIYAKGIGNRIVNNILVGSAICDRGIRSFFMADERCDHHEYIRNVICFEPGETSATGTFGRGVGNLQGRGSALTWRVDAPAAGEYTMWVRYACQNEPYGYTAMDGRTVLRVPGGAEVPLNNLPDTGGWGEQAWGRAASVSLPAEACEIEWKNVRGGGINLDAIVFTDDATWRPDGTALPQPAKDKHVIVVQAEDYTSRDGERRQATRYAYAFVNWSDDRVTKAEGNVWYAPDARVTIKGGPADGSVEQWRTILDGRFAEDAIAADPGFANVAARDFSLNADSPARKVGFEPIDTSRIGLKADYPSRLARE